MSEAEQYVKDWLERTFGYKVSRGEGYDFNAEKDDLKIAIEVKSTDISKPTGNIVIGWSEIDALMRAGKNGRKVYLFLLTKEEKYYAIFGLVECHAVSYLNGEEINIEQQPESPFVLSEPS